MCVFIDWTTIPASFRPLPFQPHFCAEVFVFRFQDQHSAEVMYLHSNCSMIFVSLSKDVPMIMTEITGAAGLFSLC